jgi:cell division transport system ATP-binding protein
VLTGASGAGKSSLLKLIYLAHRPGRGLIRLFDEDIATLPRERLAPIRRRIGVVFQEFRLLDHLTTMDNAALPLRLTGVKPSQYKDRRGGAADLGGSGAAAARMPATLSGGEKQRPGHRRARWSGKPDILLADEPTGNVRPGDGQRILRCSWSSSAGTPLHRQATTRSW